MTADVVDGAEEQRISGERGEERRGATLAGCHRGTMDRLRRLGGRGDTRMDRPSSTSRRGDAVGGRTSTVYYEYAWFRKHSDGVWEYRICSEVIDIID